MTLSHMSRWGIGYATGGTSAGTQFQRQFERPGIRTHRHSQTLPTGRGRAPRAALTVRTAVPTLVWSVPATTLVTPNRRIDFAR